MELIELLPFFVYQNDKLPTSLGLERGEEGGAEGKDHM